MMNSNPKVRALLVSILLIAVAGRWSTPVARGDDSRLARLHGQQLWEQGADEILNGEFKQARKTFDDLSIAVPGDPTIEKVRGWLDAFDELDAKRNRIRQREYDRHVKIAQNRIVQMHVKPMWMAAIGKPMEEIRKVETGKLRDGLSPDGQSVNDSVNDLYAHAMENWGIKPILKPVIDAALFKWRTFSRFHRQMQYMEWTDVLADARYAMMNAKDEDQFRQEPWLDEIVAECISAADDMRKEGEWLSASGIYYELSEIFPADRGFDDALKECNGHARLDALYKPAEKPEEMPEWREDVRKIYEDMMVAVLRKIETNYVQTPDFKKIARSGINALLLTAESETLKESYAGLRDEFVVESFKSRLDKILRRIDRSRRYTRADCEDHFKLALRINRESVAMDTGFVISQLVHGSLDELDEFSSVIWPAAVEDFRKHTVGEYAGVGIQIRPRGGQIEVVTPLEGSPAYDAGIQPGDIIVSVDGESTEGFTTDDAVEKITGPLDTIVNIGIERPGVTETLEFPLKRDTIRIVSVKGFERHPDDQWDFMIDPNQRIGYIRVGNFVENTTQEMQRALSELESQGVRGVILDLRFNPGGLLRSAVEMSELFLQPGQLVVSTKGRDTQLTEPPIRADDADHNYPDLPLYVLVNEYSASASEIVSGALKDHDRGLVVGDRTFGKGSVQTLNPIGDRTGPRSASAFLKLTTARYYLPDGQCIHREPDSEVWGVDPKIDVKAYPREIAYVLEQRRKSDIMRGKNHEDEETVSVEEQIAVDPDEEKVDADLQLRAALLAMRVQLMQKSGGPRFKPADVAISDKRPKSNDMSRVEEK